MSRRLPNPTARLWLLAFAALACDDEAAKPARQLSEIKAFQGLPPLPAGPVAGRPWALRGCTGGLRQADELACVQGEAITRAQFDAAQREQPPGTPPRATLQSLIDEALLAKAAAEKGLWNSELTALQRRAMVARLLQRTFEEALTPDKISDADIETTFKNQQVRVHYDHVAAYFVTDVQFLCCSGDWRQCEKREEVRACIDKLAPQAKALFEALQTDPPRSVPELKARVAQWQSRFPLVTVQDVEFWYDKAKSYEEQTNYDRMVKEFTLPVVNLKPGELSQPLRSPFGWHLPRLTSVDPAQHKTWRDPAVRAEIAEHVIQSVRERDVLQRTAAWLAKAGVQFFYDKLDAPY